MNINDLISAARDDLLGDGRVTPMVYLELAGGLHLLTLDIFDREQSIIEQASAIARHVWKYCKQYPGEAPLAAGMYGCAWVSSDPDAGLRLRPNRDPERREILSVSLWQARGEPAEQTYSLAVVRDTKGRVVELGEPERPVGKITIHLRAVVKGAQDAQRPDDEVLGPQGAAVLKRLAALSPEQQGELLDLLKRGLL